MALRLSGLHSRRPDKAQPPSGIKPPLNVRQRKDPHIPPPSRFIFTQALGKAESDLEVTKRQWGAFYGTDLELQLRRRGIDTIVLCGISTNIGVESTARNAWELGFSLVIAEDACSAASAEQHQGSMTHIFPRIARVRSVDEIVSALL